MEDFYIKNAEKYIQNYKLKGTNERWLINCGQGKTMLGVRQYFDELSKVLEGRIKYAFDIGVGPAAREIIRFISFGWDANGCDVSKDVINLARNELLTVGIDPNKIFEMDARRSIYFGDRKYDLISCLNVIQHFENISEIVSLASACANSTNPGGIISILFKRSDFNEKEIIQDGLQLERLDSDGLFRFFDKTFDHWRDYRTFYTEEIISIFNEFDFFGIQDYQAVIKFSNVRGMPCSILTMQKK
jgi:predicted SAM-dependent methyltransferase